jgi:4-hydroxy-3-polyprenylbenzoate decarboxylase/2,5-furandicarboxylate decarboxylase 1
VFRLDTIPPPFRRWVFGRVIFGIDATFPFGAEVRSATDVPAAGHVCGAAVAEHGHEFFEVAAVPGWQQYDFPELRNRTASAAPKG